MCEPAAQKPSNARPRPSCIPCASHNSFRILPGLACQDFQEPPRAKLHQDRYCLPSHLCISSLAWASALIVARMPALPCCTIVSTWVDCGPSALQNPSWLAAGLLLDAGSASTKGGQVMFRPQPLLQLPCMGPCGQHLSSAVQYEHKSETAAKRQKVFIARCNADA